MTSIGCTDELLSQRVGLFGIQIDCLTLSEATRHVLDWTGCARTTAEHCRYVVTPNLDHVVQLRRCAALRRAYHKASLVVADGWPIVAASRLFKSPLPERVAGSDLVPSVFAAAQQRSTPLSVYLLGAAPGVAETAAERMQSTWPNVRVSGVDSPAVGFERSSSENEAVLRRIEQSEPELLIVGLGAPKQETWLHRHRRRIAARVAVAAGATIDFLAGRQHRAPAWMQRSGAEWVHRLAGNPRRLAGRYARDAAALPILLWREWKFHRRTTASTMRRIGKPR